MSWANHDCPTVLTYVAETFPSLERIWIGHSIGGHLPGMMPDTKLIDRIITVGAGTGTWWYNAWPTRRIAWLLWYVIVPVTVPIFGYFPGNKLGILCDMPKGVIMQWRRWCLHRNYCVYKPRPLLPINRGFQENNISVLLLFDVTRHAFKVAP
jgi:predicted alpha/beta hydrolase